MNLFELDNVTRSYGNRTVLNISYLNLKEDCIYAVLGPNGAGKTTMLRVLNLLDEPDKGHIKFMGVDITSPDCNKFSILRQMCMVFQRSFMFRSTVYNNVAYGLKLRRVPGPEIDKRVREAVNFVGLADFINRPATKLSGGETQRVALARALVLRPRVLLLDEPTTNLDPNSVQLIEEIIGDSQSQYGMSVIIVTHNLFQAKRISDETILLMDGEVVEKGETKKIFTNPQDDRTRQFLNGTMIY
jgi:tungstate transport system ATP-binding protein